MKSYKRKISLENYTSSWEDFFLKEKLEIEQYLKKHYNEFYVEHVGSTSVEGLKAKPIIDIALGIPRNIFEDYRTFADVLGGIGYCEMPNTKIIIPNRNVFCVIRKSIRYHLHSCIYNDKDWLEMIYVRNFLRENPDYKKQYVQSKVEAIKNYPFFPLLYNKAKGEQYKLIKKAAFLYYEK